MSDTTATKPVIQRARQAVREPQPVVPPPSNDGIIPTGDEKSKTKASLILELLERSEGVTLDELITATGWLPHTTRAALTGVRKKGYALVSEKVGGLRRYRVTAAQAEAAQ